MEGLGDLRSEFAKNHSIAWSLGVSEQLNLGGE